jgi:hypothetical protein
LKAPDSGRAARHECDVADCTIPMLLEEGREDDFFRDHAATDNQSRQFHTRIRFIECHHRVSQKFHGWKEVVPFKRQHTVQKHPTRSICEFNIKFT